jgi:Tfp pilus assembly protein PilF
VLGPEHPNTATSLNNLGSLLWDQGDLAGARSYYERAFQVFQSGLGEVHPSTQVVRRNLEA